MAYCLLADLYNGLNDGDLVKLTDDGQTGNIDGAVAAAALEKGAQIIDSFIGQVTSLPLNGQAPAPLPALNQDLAIYELYARVSTEVPEVWKDKHQRALGLLGDIAAGKLVLYPDPGNSQGQPKTMTSAVRTKVFSIKELDRF